MICLWQLQEKCREQQMLMYIAFINLTKTSDLVSRDSLFHILLKTGCAQKLHTLIKSFHDDMKAGIQYDSNTPESFSVCS